MNTPDAALLLNLLGFAVGMALYAMLLVMTLQRPKSGEKFDFLLPLTAGLGLLWNAGELFTFLQQDFAKTEISPFIPAIAYAALGFLPAVVVHSAQTSTDNKSAKASFLTFAAYLLSGIAALLHFYAAFFQADAPSHEALQLLIVGYAAILGALFLLTFRQSIQSKAVLASALAVFAVSALHLSLPHQEGQGSWFIELVGHQASLPLALAILYQDFRFAFADLFLKRGLSLVLLAATAFGLYIFIAVPLLQIHAQHEATDSQPIFILLGLWMATALVYQYLHRLAVWFVDKILLRRANYAELRAEIGREIAEFEAVEPILDKVCETLAAALTANKANWQEIEPQPQQDTIIFKANSAETFIPTAENPFYKIYLSEFSGARRLLSDEIEMLEDVALIVARRIDAVRVTHERCEQEIREQAIGKLASEAELRALRAQINPHFLFNALTTIGYLINTAPDRALETLLRLTQLLRGVLRSNSEFSTLGDELKLIESYLEIERARFEERLSVEIDVSPELRNLRVPALILQPLVENSIKHGISKQKRGGEIKISARIEAGNLILEVADTGAGLNENFTRGVGLSNIENRLQTYFGENANLNLCNESEKGTIAKIKLPLSGAKSADFVYEN